MLLNLSHGLLHPLQRIIQGFNMLQTLRSISYVTDEKAIGGHLGQRTLRGALTRPAPLPGGRRGAPNAELIGASSNGTGWLQR